MTVTRIPILTEIEWNAAPQDERIVALFRYDTEAKTTHPYCLAFLADIHSTQYIYERLLETIHHAVDRLRALVAGMDADPLARFEKLIQGVNEAIAQELGSEENALAWNRINLMLLQSSDGQLCVSGIGSLANVFLQKQDDGSSRVFDLLGSLDQPSIPRIQKLFPSVLAGDMTAGDVFFVGTANFERLRQELALIDILKHQPPVTAAIDIQNTLKTLEIADDFAGLVLAQRSSESVPQPQILISQGIAPITETNFDTDSVQQMYKKEQNTDALLQQSDDVPRSRRSLAELWQILVGYIRRGWFGIRKRVSNGTHSPVLLAGLRTMNAGHGSKLTTKQKRWGLVSVGGIFLLFGLVFGYQAYARSRTEAKTWQDNFTTASQKRDRAETSLIYGNETEAAQLLSEAIVLAAGLKNDTDARRTQHSTLEESLNKVRTKLLKEQTVATPAVFVDLGNETAAAQLGLINISKGWIYAFDRHGKQIIALQPAENRTRRIPWTATSLPVVSAAGIDGVYFLNEDKTIVKVGADNDTLTTINWEAPRLQRIKAAVVYGRRLYVLDDQAGMVWRYSIGNGFSQETPYIQQTSQPLTNATSLAIDSNVYILQADGHLQRFLSGTESAWAPTQIQPSLQGAIGLWAANGSDYLIVGDAKHARLVIYRTTDGKLVAQLMHKDLQAMTGFTVDTNRKTMFITTPTRIIGIDLP